VISPVFLKIYSSNECRPRLEGPFFQWFSWDFT